MVTGILKASIFKDGHNLQIRSKDKEKGEDKGNAMASDLKVVFTENFREVVSLSKVTSFFSNFDDISNKPF